MKSFLNEFKEFAMKGNVMDMAVGIIIGGAFAAIVTSLCDDLLSPIIGLLFKADFSKVVVTAGGVDFKIGAFIMAVINFLIIAFVLFCIIKAVNKAAAVGKKEEEEAAPETKQCPYCKSDIPVDATRCPHCTSEVE